MGERTLVPTPEELQVAWNENRGEMLEWRSLDVLDRRRLATLRLRECPDLPRWVKAIRRASESDFCTGRAGSANGTKEPFIGMPDWLLKPGTLVLIEEGTFDSRTTPPLPDAERSPKDLSYFNLEKDMRKLSQEETRKLRMGGFAIRAWERERKGLYGQKRDNHGTRIGEDPRAVLVDWAFGKTQEVPGLVKNYGPPLDTPLAVLEKWMEKPGMPWREKAPLVGKDLEARKAMLEDQRRLLIDEDVPF